MEGHLLSIHSKEENEWIHSNIHTFLTTSLWTGLVADRQKGGYQWTDGSSVTYTNWHPGQPNGYSVGQECVDMWRASGTWNDLGCSYELPFICEAHKISPPVTTVAPPQACNSSKDWVQYKGSCYLFVYQYYSWKSWSHAEKDCQAQSGHLASVTDLEEQTFITNTVHYYTQKNVGYWIGMRLKYTNGPWIWSDDSYPNFFNWRKGEPNNYKNSESCVELYPWNGRWNDQHCGLPQAYICQRAASASSTRVPPTLFPPVVPARCPQGWVTYAESKKCYKVFDAVPMSWQDARQACQGLKPHDAGQLWKDLDLVSMHSSLEQDFILLNIANTSSDVWIGMDDRHVSGWYLWADQTDSDYSQWGVEQPNSQAGHCVSMMSRKSQLGLWQNQHCYRLSAYVCQMKKDNTIPINPHSLMLYGSSKQQVKCPKDFFPYNNHCYHITNFASSWESGQKACKKLNATLASIEVPEEDAFVRVLRAKTDPVGRSLWIGMQKKAHEYKWTDGSPVKYTRWADGQPSENKLEECVLVNARGFWEDGLCHHDYRAVCKYPEMPAAKGAWIIDSRATAHMTYASAALNGFEKVKPISVSLGDNRKVMAEGKGSVDLILSTGRSATLSNVSYVPGLAKNLFSVVLNKALSMGDASIACKQQGATLASFHSQDDLNAVKDIIQWHNNEFWIGLVEESSGSWKWTDNTPFDFDDWTDTSTQTSTSKLACAYITKDGQWQPSTCSAKRKGYICRRKTVAGKVPVVHPTNHPADHHANTPDDTSFTNRFWKIRSFIKAHNPARGIPALGILGILMGIVCGMLVAMAVMSYLTSTSRARVNTDNQNNDNVELVFDRPAHEPSSYSKGSSRGSTALAAISGAFKKSPTEQPPTGFENIGYSVVNDAAFQASQQDAEKDIQNRDSVIY